MEVECGNSILQNIMKQQLLLIEFIEKLMEHDKEQIFLYPVNARKVRFYKKTIKEPMDLSTMKCKVKKHEYKNWTEFEKDFKLIISNCISFNGCNNYYSNMAIKLDTFYESEAPAYKQKYEDIEKEFGKTAELKIAFMEESKNGIKRKRVRKINNKDSVTQLNVEDLTNKKNNHMPAYDNLHMFPINPQKTTIKKNANYMMNTIVGENRKMDTTNNQAIFPFTETNNIHYNIQNGTNKKMIYSETQCQLGTNAVNNVNIRPNNMQMAFESDFYNKEIPFNSINNVNPIKDAIQFRKDPKIEIMENGKNFSELNMCINNNSNYNVSNNTCIKKGSTRKRNTSKKVCREVVNNTVADMDNCLVMDQSSCNKNYVNRNMFKNVNDKKYNQNIHYKDIPGGGNNTGNNGGNSGGNSRVISNNITNSRDVFSFTNHQGHVYNSNNKIFNNTYINNSNMQMNAYANMENNNINKNIMQNNIYPQNAFPNLLCATSMGINYKENRNNQENCNRNTTGNTIDTIDPNTLSNTISLFLGKGETNRMLSNGAFNNRRNQYPSVLKQSLDLNPFTYNHIFGTNALLDNMVNPQQPFTNLKQKQMSESNTPIMKNNTEYVQLQNVHHASNAYDVNNNLIIPQEQKKTEAIENSNILQTQDHMKKTEIDKNITLYIQNQTHKNSINEEKLLMNNADYNGSVKKFIGNSNLPTVVQVFPQINDIFNNTSNNNTIYTVFGDVEQLFNGKSFSLETSNNKGNKEKCCNDVLQTNGA